MGKYLGGTAMPGVLNREWLWCVEKPKAATCLGQSEGTGEQDSYAGMSPKSPSRGVQRWGRNPGQYGHKAPGLVQFS